MAIFDFLVYRFQLFVFLSLCLHCGTKKQKPPQQPKVAKVALSCFLLISLVDIQNF